MMRRRNRLFTRASLRMNAVMLLAAAVAFITGAPAVHAQSAIAVDATVAVASPTGAGAVRNLQFGTIILTPGVPTTVSVPAAAAPQSANVYAAEFAYGVSGMAGMDLAITLPSTLLSADGTKSLAMSFTGTQYGGHCTTVGAGGCSLTPFDPAVGTVRICAGYKGNGECKNQVFAAGAIAHAYIGGSITVPPTQLAATYTGTITAYIVQVY
jgi:hypothetical protein